MNAGADSHVTNLVRCAKALVFDFDGTLVDSNPIKRHAFELCFEEFSEQRSEILAYCWSNHHVSRTEKFRHVYEKILALPYTEDVAAMLHERFAAATTSQIVAAPEVPAASRFLLTAARTHVTALLSSTPHETLLQIVEGRGWRDYFEMVRGAPVDKAGWLESFREEREFHENDVVLFGDTLEDARAAQEARCTFVAIGRGRMAVGTRYSIPDFTGAAAL